MHAMCSLSNDHAFAVLSIAHAFAFGRIQNVNTLNIKKVLLICIEFKSDSNDAS